MSDSTPLPSNKTFGLFFSAIFAIAAIITWHHSFFIWMTLLILLALGTLAVTLTRPERLTPFNKAWLALGLLLAKIVSPIVLGFLFFVLITPIALGMRLMGRDELRLKMNEAATHWKERSPLGPEPDSFKNQF